MVKSIVLQKGREKSLERRHPWIFSGAIKFKPKDLEEGELVKVTDVAGNILAMAHYQEGSIMARIVSFEDVEVNQDFWNAIIQDAAEYRVKIMGVPNEGTNAFRLFHGEGDGIPGLVIDVYDATAVVQCHSIGVHKSLNLIVNALVTCSSLNIKKIFHKSKDTLPEYYAKDIEDAIVYGDDADATIVVENSNQFYIHYDGGQKTGFFLDQRDNRALVGSVSNGKSVLNCFCYTGGFSVYALNSGASLVHSIDISSKAMDLCDKNVALCQNSKLHTSFTANVMEYLKEDDGQTYDIVIVDPPAFAKSINKRHNAVQAYKRLNTLAMRKVKKGGLLFTFSCSQVISSQLFYDTIIAAGIEANVKARVMKHLSQGADHPVNLFHPEGHYLKGLMLNIQ